MFKSKVFYSCIIIVLVGLMARIGYTTEEQKKQDEMMQKWLAYSTPGKYHKVLEYYVGDWTFESKQWLAPEAPPQISQGSSKAKMILGGRYLKMHYKGQMMGMTFEGISFTGYDNFKKKYHSIWIDNMSTGFFPSSGLPGKDVNVREETAIWDDIMTGGESKVRTVYSILNANKFKIEMYEKKSAGKKYKSMEIAFTRKK